jgi:hypothetical protein
MHLRQQIADQTDFQLTYESLYTLSQEGTVQCLPHNNSQAYLCQVGQDVERANPYKHGDIGLPRPGVIGPRDGILVIEFKRLGILGMTRLVRSAHRLKKSSWMCRCNGTSHHRRSVGAAAETEHQQHVNNVNNVNNVYI